MIVYTLILKIVKENFRGPAKRRLKKVIRQYKIDKGDCNLVSL